MRGDGWVTALRAPAIAALASDDGPLQMSLFDTQNFAEISHPDYRGERLICCRNPALADERARKRRELIKRLLTGRCELCKRTDNIEVHHVRKLADLAATGTTPPTWAQAMANKRRKILVVCRDCHDLIHARAAQLTQ